MKHYNRKIAFSISGAGRRAVSLAIALTVAASMIFAGFMPASADSKSKTVGTRLTEDQKALHLLNRIGYGPRPGDLERVKRMGLDKFIEQQLHPERIDDSAVEARLKGLDSINMGITELYEKYPAPQLVAVQLGLRQRGKADQQPGDQTASASQGDQADTQQDKREMRQKVFAYYAENGLRPPARLLQELQAQKIIRATYSERQLQEVMTDFWFNHFNIFWGKGADRWMTSDFEMNTIRPHTLGKFEDLLLATAKSPAMLFYLDNFQSSSPDAQLPGRRGNGRRGRFQRNKRLNNPRFGNLNNQGNTGQQQRRLERDEERGQMGDQGQMTPEQQRRQQIANQFRNRKPGINENYARELMELHTLGVDGGYTQKDVQEVARAFTGWSIEAPRRSGKFVYRSFMHDEGEKTVLGHRISEGGMKDGEKVIEILAHHPNTAKFISTKLVRRFVSDNPPQSLVDQVTSVYLKTDGDISAMLKTIFTSKEFYAPESYRAKIKSPFELAVSAIRALGGETHGVQQTSQFIAKMGQPLYLYQPPTGYPDRAEQWVNTGALLERLNFGLALSANRVRGTSVDLEKVVPDLDPADNHRVMQSAIAVLLNGEISSQTQAILDRQLKEGVSVKGELGELPKIATGEEADAADGDTMMMEDAPIRRPAKGGKGFPGARAEKRDERYGWSITGARRLDQTANDPQLAKVFGLVLGSPEFQRR